MATVLTQSRSLPTVRRRGRPPSRLPYGLSRAEIRALAYAAAGYTNDETARSLVLDPETIRTQRAACIHKMSAGNMPNAVATAFIDGIFSPRLQEQIARLAKRRPSRCTLRHRRA